MYVCMYVCMYACMYVCMYTYQSIYVSRLWVLRHGFCIQMKREEHLLLLHSTRLFQMED